MMKIIIFILIIFFAKILLIKKENEIVKHLIILEKKKSKILMYFLILCFCIIFFYKSIVFFHSDYTNLILIYLFNNIILTIFMKYFSLKIYYYYYYQTIKFANFSFHNLRIATKKKYIMLLCFFSKRFNKDFVSINISERRKKIILHTINIFLLMMYDPIIYIIIYFYVFVMDDRNDGFVNGIFFREKVILNSDGNEKLFNYGKYLLNTNKKIPSFKYQRDFEYVNHECY